MSVTLCVLLLLLCGFSFGLEAERANYLRSLHVPPLEQQVLWHFYASDNVAGPLEPARVKNLSPEEFDAYAEQGIPVIVEDGIRQWPSEWRSSCAAFVKTFPHETVIPQPYTTNLSHGARQLHALFDSPDWSVPFGLQDDPAFNPMQDPLFPTVRSWFTPLGFSAGNASAVKLLHSFFSAPYFVSRGDLALKSLLGRAEFFLGNPGSGVAAHTDPQCQGTLSAQMAGRKRWRLALPLSARAMEDANPGYRFAPPDAAVLSALSLFHTPLYDFVMEPGDVLFFPAGMVHATLVEDNRFFEGDEETSKCSLSLSFPIPAPVASTRYVTAFSDRLISDIYLGGRCYLESYNRWLFGSSVPSWTGSDADSRAHAERIWPLLDADNSGIVSVDEAAEYFKSFAGETLDKDVLRTDWNVVIRDHHELVAEAFVVAHDRNRDNHVAQWELEATLMALWRPYFAQMSLRALHLVSLDHDMNAMIDEDELYENYPQIPWSEVSSLDTNQDGVLSFEELDGRVEDLTRILLDQSPSEPTENVVVFSSSQDSPVVDRGDYQHQEDEVPVDAPAAPAAALHRPVNFTNNFVLPQDFYLVVQINIRPGVHLLTARRNKTGIGFLVFEAEKKYFVGDFDQTLARVECGTLCSTEKVCFDQRFPLPDLSYASLTKNPEDTASDGQFACEFDVIEGEPLFLSRGFDGLGLLVWRDDGAFYLGRFEQGRRIDEGVYVHPGTHALELQNWQEGEDNRA